jgi:serpin B
MKDKLALGALAAVLFAAGCVEEPVSLEAIGGPVHLAAADREILEIGNGFSFKLFREIKKQDSSANIFVSPLSASMALGMTLNGARGLTHDEMAATLGFDGIADSAINASYRRVKDYLTRLDRKVAFEIANSMWYRRGFAVEPAFIAANQAFFDAVVRELDFSRQDAADTINGWVACSTHDKITSIVRKPVDPLTEMFLINAIYFKGSWSLAFSKEETRDAQFALRDGASTTCAMMYRKGWFGYGENDALQIAELDYGERDFSMVVVLPRLAVPLDSLIDRLSPKIWSSWVQLVQKDTVSLYLPKFGIEYELKMNNILKSLGMPAAFGDSADFSGIRASGGLHIDDVRHKAFVRVDEAGTEAAAVTVVVINNRAILTNEKRFVANRPFFLAIRERATGAILFVGMVTNPKAGA